MAKRSSRITKTKPKPQGVQSSLPAPALPGDREVIRRPHWRCPLYLGLMGFALAACVLVGILTINHSLWVAATMAQADRQAAKRTDLRLCERFRELKNDGDPAANELLTPSAVVPDKPVSQEEAQRIQTACFLRQRIRILSVHPKRDGSLVLVTTGNVSAPALQVSTLKGVERSQRTMSNADLIVEVRDGKIHGVRAELHTGP